MKLTAPSTITAEDLKNPEAAAKILSTFMRQVSEAFNNGISIEDNIVGQSNSFTVLGDDAAFPISFYWKYPGKKPTLCVIKSIDSTDPIENVFSDVGLRWAYNNGNIVIQGLRGSLTSNKMYKITFLTLA